jgi:membrane-associated protein
MQILQFLISFIVHIDKHLLEFVQAYGVWVYALLFLIMFVETGVVVMPFLPGDSLLFIAGALCATGEMEYAWVAGLMTTAAILGDQCNYAIGHWVGPKVFQWENSRFFNKKAFAQANAFYERYGGITIIAARFMPFMRTFVPFVAGVSAMNRGKFTLFNVVGGVLWVVGITAVGYFFGNIPWVKQNLQIIIWGLILVPGVLALFGAWKAGRKKDASPATP